RHSQVQSHYGERRRQSQVRFFRPRRALELPPIARRGQYSSGAETLSLAPPIRLSLPGLPIEESRPAPGATFSTDPEPVPNSSSCLGDLIVVGGLPLLQRSPLQLQQSEAQLKLQLDDLLPQFGKLFADGFAHDLCLRIETGSAALGYSVRVV